MLKIASAVMAALTLFTCSATSREERAPCTSDAMIVFDASGSMAASDFPEGPPSRIDRVRTALRKVLPRASELRNLGLIVYGPGEHDSACENIDLRFGPTVHAGTKIQAQVDRLFPGGRTPLTDAVRHAAGQLGPSDKPGTVVLFTDGEETCGGDPCNLARELAAHRPNTVVHVIGYRLQSLNGLPPVSGAKCLADETGGYNLTAETIDDLVRAFEKALGCNQVSLDVLGNRNSMMK